jgi:hypothetical protein
MLGILFILVFASSCNSGQQSGQETADSRTQSPELAKTTVSTTSAPNLSSSQAAAPDPSTLQAAIQVIHDYYEAINRREYERAYNYWDRNGSASGQTLEQFRQGFAETEHVEVQTGPPSREEAAAGSLYIGIPVTITATTTDQRLQRFSGTYTLRRTNDVPGATKAQLSWHIHAANIVETGSSDS